MVYDTSINRKEYDAFGPWIYEIDGEHEVPRLFKDYCSDDTPLLLFKVPRSIERRKASPNMDMYDYLIGAYDTHLHIMKRFAGGVKEVRIGYKDIAAVKDVHALLKGELIIYTDDAAIINYNTVSEEVISKLINIITAKKTTDNDRDYSWECLPVVYAPEDQRALDLLFYNLFHKLKKSNPELELIAFQPGINIDGKYKLRKKIKNDKRILSKSAFISDGKQLIVMEREIPIRKKRKEELEYSYLYLPFKNITGMHIENLDTERQFCSLKLKAGGHAFNYIFERKNKRIWDIYRKFDTI